MKLSKNLVFAALLATALMGGTVVSVRAQGDAVSPAQSATDTTAPDASAPAFDEGKPAPVARAATLPASVRRTLPRGAKTLFCVSARLDNRAVLLHGWNTAKGNTTLDILSTTPARRSSRTRRTASTARLKRIAAGRIETGREVVVRAAPLKTGGRGSVITLKWSESQVAAAFTTVPMIALVLPNGVGGAVITQDFSTESTSGGNTFYAICTAPNGEAFMLLRDESFDGGTQNLQRFVWNGRKFERRGESVTKPLAPDG